MNIPHNVRPLVAGAGWLLLVAGTLTAEELPSAFIDGQEDGFVELGEEDFANVNCYDDTWSWSDGVLSCTGKPDGVLRTQKQYTNFELVARWRHLSEGGNSGFFIWTSAESIANLKPNEYPTGIEVQVLDLGYKTNYEKSGKRATWFTTHGDVFPVLGATMSLFPPLSPDGSRSFPSQETTKGFGEWNHYYIRGINGELRLWVNGQEVSGGKDSVPSSGYVCLESEGAPIEFTDIRIRELP